MRYEVNTMGQIQSATSLSQYLLIAMPDDSLIQRLHGYQQQLSQHLYPGAETLPIRYLTMAGLKAKDYLEETLARWIMKVCSMRPSFKLSFEKSLKFNEGVLSLEIADSPELRSFYLQLGVVDDFLSASDCLPLQLISKPQLPILIPNCTGVERPAAFNHDFKITEIAMLKKNTVYDRFDRVNVFAFAR